MKLFILAPVLALIFVSSVVVGPKIAEAGLQMQCGYEYVYRYGYRKLIDGSFGYRWAYDRVFQCRNVWVCLPFNC
jgi:hypothetical protein